MGESLRVLSDEAPPLLSLPARMGIQANGHIRRQLPQHRRQAANVQPPRKCAHVLAALSAEFDEVRIVGEGVANRLIMGLIRLHGMRQVGWVWPEQHRRATHVLAPPCAVEPLLDGDGIVKCAQGSREN